MNMKDFFSNIGGDKDPKGDQNVSETKENGINVDFSRLEFTFTSLCVDIISILCKEKPESLPNLGTAGMLLQILIQDVDIKALQERFKRIMIEDMVKS